MITNQIRWPHCRYIARLRIECRTVVLSLLGIETLRRAVLGTYCDFTEDTCSQPRSTALTHRHSKVLEMIACWTKIDGASDENRTRVLSWEYGHKYAIVMA